MNSASMSLRCIDPVYADKCADISAHYGWPQNQSDAEWCLRVGEHLSLTRNADGMNFQPDLCGGRAGWRRAHGGGVNEPIARACGLKQGKRPRVLDATPGWLRDAWVLATLGCEIVATERQPLVYVLMQDTLARAAQDPANAEIAARIELVNSDASDYLATLDESQKPDVIYLDPMFPPREKTAAVKKDMQVLQALVEVDSGDHLLAPALRCARQRVVVKRPDYAPDLAGVAPQARVPAGAHRFDVYLLTGELK